MPYVDITVRNKHAVNVNDARIVCGNSDYIARFDFDDEWTAYETKTARFRHLDGSTLTDYDVIFRGTECSIPVLTEVTKVYIGVYAGDLHTTTNAKVLCELSALCGGGVPADPEPDVYNQLMEKLNDMSGVSQESIAAAVSDYMASHPVEGTSSEISADEQLKALIETDMLPAVYDADGKILTDEANKILLRY